MSQEQGMWQEKRRNGKRIRKKERMLNVLSGAAGL